ncbi:MAG: RecX family transcriptional regulator [Bacilli bacterium]|nr:RecX family transcriptional regulator [Bacilli bacterium]
MIIKKYTKMKSNKYKVLFDDIEVKLYDDVIIKYQLLRKKEITDEEFQEITEYNDRLEAYYKALKYISNKLRTEKEVFNYLDKVYSKSVIRETIERLKQDGYLNKEVYLKSYLADQINLSNNGPEKIKKDLVKLGFTDEEFRERIDDIKDEVWLNKIEYIVKKKINTNHSYGTYKLREKILYDLCNMGYYKWMVEEIINGLDLSTDSKIIEKEYRKIYNKLSKKYEGNELTYQVKIKLLQKGFSNSEIEEII